MPFSWLSSERVAGRDSTAVLLLLMGPCVCVCVFSCLCMVTSCLLPSNCETFDPRDTLMYTVRFSSLFGLVLSCQDLPSRAVRRHAPLHHSPQICRHVPIVTVPEARDERVLMFLAKLEGQSDGMVQLATSGRT